MLNKFQQLDQFAKKTLIIEILRSVALGVIDTAASTFFLLYMVRVIQAQDALKNLVVIGSSIGLLLTPIVVQLSAGYLLSPTRLSAFLFALAGVCTLFVPVFENQYVISLLLAGALASWYSATPLAIQIYADNYPAHLRGKLFSLSTISRIFVSGITAYLFGRFLDQSLSFYKIIFLIYAGWFFINTILFLKLPSKPLPKKASNALREGFGALKTDKLFRTTIISWMFLGFGNLLLFPLRVEFLANPAYGNSLSEKEIALLVAVIPNIFRLIFVSGWGMLFDKMHFFTMRILVNISFMLGSLSFFLHSSWWLLFLGAALYGISNAGADIAWNLWVTKFAPENKNQAYMAVHTFFTGTRGILAPTLSFYAISRVGFDPLVYLGLILMGIASLILAKERVLRFFKLS